MDAITYHRALNRPTYLFWKWTKEDFQWGMLIFVALVIPTAFIDAFPQWIAPVLGFTFMIYKGVVVSMKPRGYDTHIVRSWMQPKQLNPGHTINRVFVVETIGPRKETKMSKFMARMGRKKK